MRNRIQPEGLSRRSFLLASTLSGAGILLTGRGLGQSQPASGTSFTELRRNVGIFTGRGGTIGWLVSRDAVVVVDSQFPDTARICLEGINTRSGNRPIDYLMLTHHHGDHTAGAGVFRPTAKRILSHENVPGLMKKAAAQQNNEAEQSYPDSTFGRVWVADLGKEKVHLEHFGPAHTGGDAVIHFEKANIVHMGDLVFNRRHPYIDKPAGASISNWIVTLETVSKRFSKETAYIFGHGGDGWQVTGGIPELLFQRDYLSALLDHVRSEVKAGKDKDAIVAETAPLKGFPDHGPLVPRVLQAAYEEVSAS